MTMKKASLIGRWMLGAFCMGAGILIGWMMSNFTFAHIMIAFLAFVGLCVLAVLTYAVVFDETTEQDDMTYPRPDAFDKSYEN